METTELPIRTMETASAPTLGAWILASRPKTLTAAATPVLVGSALAWRDHVFAALPALAAFVCALLIQIGTNFTNDYYDFKKGADTAERVGPKRVTQSGLISPKAVLQAAIATFGLAMVLGLYLVVHGGWPVLVIGLASIAAGYAYTGGPFPLGYNGLGDVFVFVFFGFVAVLGTYFVQAGFVSEAGWLCAIPVGALGTAILVVNNIRDAHTDAVANKRTLVVRMGVSAGQAEYGAMLGLAFGAPLALWSSGLAQAPVMLAWLSLPFALSPLRRVLHERGPALNRGLGETARLQAVFAVLLSIALMLGR